MQSLILALLLWASIGWAAPRPPYSINWNSFIKAKKLTIKEHELVCYIVQDSLWYDNEHEFESISFHRENKMNRYGLDELDRVLSKAEQGSANSLNILLVLLETSSFSRRLEGLQRDSIWTGTLLLRPDDRRGNWQALFDTRLLDH